MNNLIKNSKVVKNSEKEYTLNIDNDLIVNKITETLNFIHITDYKKYIIPNNDELINTILLRLVTEIFINKIELEDNEPYILNTIIKGINYRISITKVVVENNTNYMYGLIMSK